MIVKKFNELNEGEKENFRSGQIHGKGIIKEDASIELIELDDIPISEWNGTKTY